MASVLISSSSPIARKGDKNDAQRAHLAFLDGIRALCALFVAAYHAYLAVYITSKPTGIALYLSAPILYGHFAVPVFIVISGFCLGMPVAGNHGVLPGGAFLFFRKRARRILPPYYAALFFFIAVHALVERRAATTMDVVSHLLLVHNFSLITSQSIAINPSFWSIAVEWQIYFFFPALVVLLKKINPALALLGIASIAYPLNFWLFPTNFRDISPDYYVLFTLGVMASHTAFSSHPYWKAIRAAYPAKAASFVFLFLLIGLSQLWGARATQPTPAIILNLLTGLSAASLIMHLTQSGGIKEIRPVLAEPYYSERVGTERFSLAHLLAVRWLVFVGTFSYSLYLLHQPVLHVFLRIARRFLMNDNACFFFLLIVAIPLIVVFSYLFFLVCERPLLKRPSSDSPGKKAALL